MDHEHHFCNKQKAALSAKKAKGIIEKVIAMIEDDTYCPEVIQQIDAVKGLLDSAKKTLLVGHLDYCLEDKLKQNKAQAVTELIKIFNLQ
jgi:DNA-binding FrmR family transcriptional regulator